MPNSVTHSPAVLEMETAQGLARVEFHLTPHAVAGLVLGHGASGGIGARDLMAVTAVARSAGFSVALVEQPYRVAGRRSPAPAPRLDAAWTEVVSRLRDGELRGSPLVVGGRSAGARVACRTVGETEAVAVLCLAFPLRSPGRASAPAAQTRQSELDAVLVPTLVVQGAGDPFGIPSASPTREVVIVSGNHSLTSDLDAVSLAVREWLPRAVS